MGWRDVVNQIQIIDPAKPGQTAGAGESLGVKGRYWMARTLVDTGDLLEKRGKMDEAKQAWSLLLEAKLGRDELARARLARVGGPEPKP